MVELRCLLSIHEDAVPLECSLYLRLTLAFEVSQKPFQKRFFLCYHEAVIAVALSFFVIFHHRCGKGTQKPRALGTLLERSFLMPLLPLASYENWPMVAGNGLSDNAAILHSYRRKLLPLQDIVKRLRGNIVWECLHIYGR